MHKVSNGSRFEENGWIRVSVSGTPKERGFANGALTAKEIKEVQRMLRWFIPNSYGVDYDIIVDIVVTLLAPQIEKNFPEYYEEMIAIAAGAKSRGADVTLNDIVFWNCYYSVSYMIDHIRELINEDDSLKTKYGKLVESGLGAGAAEGGGSGQIGAQLL